jgi:DnaJ-class molecular chaperone
MNLTHHLAVAIGTTAAPTPQPDHVTAAGQAASQATETNNGTAADIASTLGPTGMLLLLLMAAFAVYVVSLSLHPNAKCNRCKGAGRHHGSIFSYAQRPCTSCKGRGVHPRLGRRVLFKQP